MPASRCIGWHRPLTGKRKMRARFRRRAAIEPRIGHLKSDYRLGRNLRLK